MTKRWERNALQLAKYLDESHVWDKKVRGTSESDPNKFIKSPMKGIAAVTNVFAMKKSASRQNLRFKR